MTYSPLNAFSNHRLRPRIQIYSPPEHVSLPKVILLICVFTAFLCLVESKQHTSICLAHHYIPSASDSAWHFRWMIQPAEYTDAWVSGRQVEKRADNGVRFSFSDFRQSFATQKHEERLLYNTCKVLSFCLNLKN